MFLNAYTRLFSRWARHPRFGVLALLPLIPLHGGDRAVPDGIEVLDDVDSEPVQQDYVPPHQRCLVYCVESDVPIAPDKGRGIDQQDRIVLGVYYMVKDLPVGLVRLENEYVMQAVVANLRMLADRVLIEQLGPPPDSADRFYNAFGPIEVSEIVDELAVRLTPGIESSSGVGVHFSTWKGASTPLTFPGV